ncbi:hypothetical protein ACX80D_16840 [Arthrobacter sp. Sr24]
MSDAPIFSSLRRCVRAMALSLILALLLSGCSMLNPTGKRLSAEGTTSADGLVLEVERAKITVPAGAIAAGTAVSAEMDPTAIDAETAPPTNTDLLPPVSGRLAVTVGQELAEGTSMTLSMDVEWLPETPSHAKTAASLALAHLATGAVEPTLIRVAWTALDSGGRITAQVPTAGTFWAVQADLPSLLRTVAATMSKAASTSKQPACVGKTAAASGMTFTAAASPGSWTCLREHNDMLVVSIAADSPFPMRVATQEKRIGTSVLDATELPPYFHQILKPLLDQNRGLAAAMPGATVDYESGAAGVESLDWELRPYPAMFLLNHLASLVQSTMEAIATPGDIDASRTAQCVAPLLERTKEHRALEESWAVPFIKGFMECIAGSVEISQRMDVLLGAANAVPSLIAGAAVEQWSQLTAVESSTVAIAGEMEWTTYTGTINAAKISFSHPAAWTVMDGSVNQQFAASNSLVVYNHNGNRKATLSVLNGIHASAPVDIRPVIKLGQTPGTGPLSSGKGFEVNAVAMDLSREPALRTRHNLKNNVQVSMSVAAAATEGKATEEMVVGSLAGAVMVETGVRSVPQNQTQRYVIFAHSEGFDTMEAAKEFAKSSDFAAIQKMLASFTG